MEIQLVCSEDFLKNMVGLKEVDFEQWNKCRRAVHLKDEGLKRNEEIDLDELYVPDDHMGVVSSLDEDTGWNKKEDHEYKVERRKEANRKKEVEED